VASTAAGTAAVAAAEQGLASGLLNTAAQLGTALGIAALVTVAAARTTTLAGPGNPTPPSSSMGSGWHSWPPPSSLC
jgi:hypothetical protein